MSEHLSHTTMTGASAWASQASSLSVLEEEASADVDEPPDNRKPKSSLFSKEAIRRPSFLQARSLLTLALKNDDDDDEHDDQEDDAEAHDDNDDNRNDVYDNNCPPIECQRSLSMSSAADLTSDTGLTSPSRANTPSPSPPEMVHFVPNRRVSIAFSEIGTKKRISFACGAPEKPRERRISFASTNAAKKPTIAVEEPAPRRPCIKFACGDTKASAIKVSRNRCVSPPPPIPVSSSVQATTGLPVVIPSGDPASTSTIHASLSRTPIKSPPNAILSQIAPLPSGPKKFQVDESTVKTKKPQYFHTFAGNVDDQDDWMESKTPIGKKITINDTLVKENVIRRLAKEVEEEEDAENEENDNDEENDEDEEDEDEDEDEEDEDDEMDDDNDDIDEAGISDGEYDSDGYHTDEETGFASSDDEDDDLHLWVLTNSTPIPCSVPIKNAHKSSSKATSSSSSYVSRSMSKKARRPSIRPGTPELPDSTDFVCGTFDEDRPMESAYLSCIEQRRLKKLCPIPQDIDPSFPASDPEDETESIFEALKSSSGEHMLLHGDLDDLNHDQDRRGRRKSKSKPLSPKRFHSPAPKGQHARSPAPRRMFSPPPKARRAADRQSPKMRARSPAPFAHCRVPISPLISPTHGRLLAMPLPRINEMTQTKSLPRAGVTFAPPQGHKYRKGRPANKKHVRGAIDIIKGLERKRQKRKEKMYQEYCNRARKGQKESCKMLPGQGAEKMKVIGLLQSGKNLSQVKAQLQQPPAPQAGGNYMMSV
ncbi:hypothetical protein Cpir12675_000505 [Ceratocystis pirilliformis]|uniref:Uncharacterized protein n=1 Tax=Ceratocystis pirilliformis TaxID=259994 RepID=A0ABR3ZM51_9PEZI